MSKAQIKSRVEALRAEMAKHNVDGFYIPRADQFQNEYVPPCNNRLEYITNFAGSAGSAFVLKDTAAFFTDGRYTLQAIDEVPADIFEIYNISPNQHPTPTLQPAEWIGDKLPENSKLGFDPWIITPMQYDRLKSAAAQDKSELVAIQENLIDKIWSHRPEEPKAKAAIHPIEFAGVSHGDKISSISQTLKKENCGALVLTFPEEICWLLNIRGQDVDFNPLVLCYAILYADENVDLFIHAEKLDNEVKKHLGEQITIHDFEKFEDSLHSLKNLGATVWIDSDTTPYAVKDILEHDHVKFHEAESPIQMAKACKNNTEMEGAINAHIRDGVALAKFLCKLGEHSYVAHASELGAANDLHGLRKTGEYFKDLSFETISGAGPAGAIIHYRVTENSDKPLLSGPLYLVDSGAQYLDGTTDVTRTVALDTPSDEMIDAYTRVLKGHIQVAISQFPKGTTGADLDGKARAALKDVGLDYPHGTGHGVGSYLCVHEGPCGIHARAKTPLLPGMIVSNEPGYYKPGEYGIRIENLIMVVETGTKNDEGVPIYGFKTLTMAPIDMSCVNVELLDKDEKSWLNAYHAGVYDHLAPHLKKSDAHTFKWLETATRAV